MSRRGNGEGSIGQRKDGRWQAVITLEDGRRVWLYGRTRRDVADKLAIASRAREQGVPFTGERQTVGAYLEAWLAQTKSKIRWSTWRRYELLVRIHVLPALAGVRLARLQPQHLEALYSARLESGAAPRSVAHVHAVMRRALGQAVRVDLVPRNVALLVDPPRVARYEMQTLSEEQARRFLAAASTDRLEALYVLALTTGMRQGELLGLRWRDLDLDTGAAHVRQAITREDGRFRLAEPKSKSSRRRITLTQSAIAALRRHRSAQAAERLALGGSWQDEDLVFPNTIGGVLDPSNLMHSSFRPVLERSGVPRIRFHDLRHTCATIALGRSVHPKIVSEMLGHSSVAITLDLYSHVTPTMQREAAATFDAVLAGA